MMRETMAGNSMRTPTKTSVVIALATLLSSCGNWGATHCSSDCKASGTTTNITQENDNAELFETDSMEHDSLKPGRYAEEALVCTLTGAEQAARKELLQKEIFSQLTKFEEVEMGYIFYFKYDEGFLMKMTDYMLAENSCCPFLTFETKVHAKEDATLKITGPSAEAKEMIRMAIIDDK